MHESKRVKYIHQTVGIEDAYQIDNGGTDEDEGFSDESKIIGRNSYWSSAVRRFFERKSEKDTIIQVLREIQVNISWKSSNENNFSLIE